MAKYVVKTTYVATDDNPNFAGETQIWFTGKGECLSQNIEFCEGWSSPRWAKDYIKKSEEYDEPFWNRTYEIVQYTRGN